MLGLCVVTMGTPLYMNYVNGPQTLMKKKVQCALQGIKESTHIEFW